MPPLSLELQTFLYRALFGASVGYLVVAIVILRPDNWFGLAHCAWAIICVIGSRKAVKEAKEREAASKQPPPPQAT